MYNFRQNMDTMLDNSEESLHKVMIKLSHHHSYLSKQLICIDIRLETN